MYKYRRLMVCLDQSEADAALIEAAKIFAKSPYASNIYFFTVVQSLELPHQIHDQYPDLIAPIDETIEKTIWDVVKDVAQGTDIDVAVDVREGNATDQILKWSNEKEIDLLMLGNKPFEHGSGHHKDKIINTAHCSVMVIPQHLKDFQIENILVPSDFSNASISAFKKAESIANAYDATITVFHSYEVPTGYHTTGKTHEEFAEIMLGHAQDNATEFIKNNSEENVETLQSFVLDKHGSPHKLILQAAIDTNADLIILGSKGRTGLSSVLLGSVAAKLIKSDCPVPVLVVKGKQENLGLLRAILEL